jgi:polyribonucleotide nucleotidyltransferase
MNPHTFDLVINSDNRLILSTGTLAPQANAAVMARWGNTVVLATVVMGKVDESKDYFPLQVEFVDKLYAGGIVKGGKWVKRELNPSDSSILFGRIIDRSVRPLFPAGFQNEVQLIVTVLSNDKEHDVIFPAFQAASAALAISDIPFRAPVSLVQVGQIEGQLIAAPTISQFTQSSLDLLVCTGPQGVNMIECEAGILDNELVFKAIELAKTTGDSLNSQIDEWTKAVGKAKAQYQTFAPDANLIAQVKDLIKDEIDTMFAQGQDGSHNHSEDLIKDKVKDHFKSQIDSGEIRLSFLFQAVDSLIKQQLRSQTLKGIRFDKRALDEIRPLNIEVGILPCTHGSALFQRGLTQALTVTTLGSLAEKQFLEDSRGETTKRYIHYYSAMPFSTGQSGRVGRPGRREIGHGALAEKALRAVIPSETEFPYTIVLTSEVLSQNGSSSMASTCGSTMSLMDAGVPIKDIVGGISVGLISESDDLDTKYVLLTDIAGVEDHFGDMDFKITGTKTGITAIQLDIKRPGLSLDMIRDTFVASTQARLKILAQMEAVLATPRPQLSAYAPKVQLVKVPEDKIGEIIGSGGKTIRALMEKYGVQIEIDDNGQTSISAIDSDAVAQAAYEIESMIKEVQIGEEYEGIVTRIENYGAFIEFLPGREALLHVSEMSGGFISDPSSIIKMGEKVKVKISGFNDNHQIKLSAPEFKAAHPGQPRPENNRVGLRPQGQKPFGSFRPDLKRKPRNY